MEMEKKRSFGGVSKLCVFTLTIINADFKGFIRLKGGFQSLLTCWEGFPRYRPTQLRSSNDRMQPGELCRIAEFRYIVVMNVCCDAFGAISQTSTNLHLTIERSFHQELTRRCASIIDSTHQCSPV